jgi:hypothetical protein
VKFKAINKEALRTLGEVLPKGDPATTPRLANRILDDCGVHDALRSQDLKLVTTGAETIDLAELRDQQRPEASLIHGSEPLDRRRRLKHGLEHLLRLYPRQRVDASLLGDGELRGVGASEQLQGMRLEEETARSEAPDALPAATPTLNAIIDAGARFPEDYQRAPEIAARLAMLHMDLAGKRVGRGDLDAYASALEALLGSKLGPKKLRQLKSRLRAANATLSGLDDIVVAFRPRHRAPASAEPKDWIPTDKINWIGQPGKALVVKGSLWKLKAPRWSHKYAASGVDLMGGLKTYYRSLEGDPKLQDPNFQHRFDAAVAWAQRAQPWIDKLLVATQVAGSAKLGWAMIKAASASTGGLALLLPIAAVIGRAGFRYGGGAAGAIVHAVVDMWTAMAVAHHQDPHNLRPKTFSVMTREISLLTIPPLAIATSLDPTGVMGVFFDAFVLGTSNGGFLSNPIHKLAHEHRNGVRNREPQNWYERLAKAGELVTPDEHNRHHRKPFRGHYDPVSGATNAFLDSIIPSLGIDLWAVMERGRYVIDGTIPNTWLEGATSEPIVPPKVLAQVREELQRRLAIQMEQAASSEPVYVMLSAIPQQTQSPGSWQERLALVSEPFPEDVIAKYFADLNRTDGGLIILNLSEHEAR